MIIATQYYRPPFPERHRWANDFDRIRDAGFDAVYVWATWGWIEPSPGEFIFDDYDELFAHARRNDLRLIVNTIAELQPDWILRELPGTNFVDHTGRAVIPTTLAYSNAGQIPGGCSDHAAIHKLTERFLATVAGRYGGANELLAWDAWNEMRVASHSDGYICYCEATLAAYRQWLQDRYSSLDELNRRWHRRHRSWDDIRPGRVPARSGVDYISFQQFLSWRTCRELAARVAALRGATLGTKPVFGHVAFPGIEMTGSYYLPYEQAMLRGNDWELSQEVDAFGCSHFPIWFDMSPSRLGARHESIRCAAGDKPFWASELQGGSARYALEVQTAVPAQTQQRWLWNAIGRGAKGVNFWCWRDEVFGREAAGFGVVGDDGHRDERLAAFAHTNGVVSRWRDLLRDYRPDPATVAVVFEPDTYYLDFALTGDAADQAGRSVQGYLEALEQAQIPYDVLQPRRIGDLSRYRLVVLPWSLIVAPDLAAALTDWVARGGVFMCETECDAYDSLGFYRYPDERSFALSVGIHGTGRRPLSEEKLSFTFGDSNGWIRAATWLETIALDGIRPVGAEQRGGVVNTWQHGRGQVVFIGTHAGRGHSFDHNSDLPKLLASVADSAGATTTLNCDVRDGHRVQWRIGSTGAARLLFVTNEGPALTANFTAHSDGLPDRGYAEDLLSGERFPVQLTGTTRELRLEMTAGQYLALLFHD